MKPIIGLILLLSAATAAAGVNRLGVVPVTPLIDEPVLETALPTGKVFATTIDIAEYFVGSFPERLEGGPRLDITVHRYRPDEGYMFMRIVTSGLLDDSVLGESWRLRIKPVDGGWTILSGQKMIKCRRGENAGNWTSKPCP